MAANWDHESTGYYIGIEAAEPEEHRLLMGPFLNSYENDFLPAEEQSGFRRQAALLHLRPVRELARRIEPSLDPATITAFPITEEVRWLHMHLGEWASYFPKVATYHDVPEVDTVAYWRSPHEVDAVRWVAYLAEERKLPVGRGELMASNRSADIESLVVADVQRSVPMLASQVRQYRGDLPPRETPANAPHKLWTLSVGYLDVGMIIVDPADNRPKAITRWERFRLEKDVDFTIRLSFSRENPREDFQDFKAHEQMDVLDVWGIEVDMKRDYEREADPYIPAPRRPTRAQQRRLPGEGQVSIFDDLGLM